MVAEPLRVARMEAGLLALGSMEWDKPPLRRPLGLPRPHKGFCRPAS
jgi:hypothetical protein